MVKGPLIVIFMNIIAVIGKYGYDGTVKSKNVTNTQNWNIEESGERSYTFAVDKNACYINLYLNKLGNTGYLDCMHEYLIAGNNKICGRLSEYYQFPLKSTGWSMKYKGNFPLTVEIEQVKCSEYGTCDITTANLYTEITSPNYPDPYPPSAKCHYTIIPLNEAICQASIYFHEFDVEDSPDCTKDRLVIGDEPFCGMTKNYRLNRNMTTNLIIKFVSDSSINGRGFKISIQQIHCGNTLNYQSECCQREYRDPYMILTSPGFLTPQLIQYDCLYTIFPSDRSSCRLRFYFRHFWVGEEDVFYGCVNGYLEIDKRRFCGCLDGYEYVSYFDEDERKDLRFSYSGPGNRGFVLEVYQEQCGLDHPYANKTDVDPDRDVEIFTTNVTSEKSVSRFLVPRDDSRCYRWMQPGWMQQVQSYLKNAPVPAFCLDQKGSQFYPDDFLPEEPAFFPPPFNPPPFIPPPDFPNIPPSVIPPPPLPNIPRPPPFLPSNCLILNNFSGQFTSPNYPYRYPPNLRLCYAIQRIPGFCKVLITFKDFDLEKSIKCWKDHVQVRGLRKYCGNYLKGKSDVFEFGKDPFIFLHFVTDSCFSGRGFLGLYKQWPCVVPGRLSLAEDHGNYSDPHFQKNFSLKPRNLLRPSILKFSLLESNFWWKGGRYRIVFINEVGHVQYLKRSLFLLFSF